MVNLQFNPFPVISTPYMVLRALQPGDAAALFALRTHADVNRFLDRAVPQTLASVEEFMAIIQKMVHRNEGIYWIIAQKSNNELMGTIGLRNFDAVQHQAEIGFELLPLHQGNGYMHRAVTHVLRYAFDVLGLQSVKAEVMAGNTPSVRLLIKHGFVKQNRSPGIYIAKAVLKSNKCDSL